MNINLEHQGSAVGYSPLFKAEASPYLSPLFGSASQRHLSSQDDFTQFKLEEQENQNVPQPEIPLINDQENHQILFPIREVLEEPEQIKILSEPEKHQIATPAFVPRPNSSPIFSIVCFLVENDSLSETDSLAFGKPLYQNCQKYESIFRVLLTKFKKLKKTKEQMIKFCMRKAFKFAADYKKSSKSSRGKKNSQKNQQKNSSSLEMPFRKNSSQKTMNSQFLRQVFSNPEFLIDYQHFIEHLQEIIEEDNNSKIQYLADSIEKIVTKGNMEELDNIKRLPWTKTILKKTEKLAKSLVVDFGPGGQQNDIKQGQD